ncbi:MAG TPA: hypothetical protein VFS76_19770 [Pyrinomonadaceae bacterium]|nr:hypothetical protein [Pyrinomonadaceae bacterium]
MSFARRRWSALLLLVLFAVASCRNASEPVTNESTANEAAVSTTPPFQTKEPDRYQATRTITIVPANGDTIVTETLIAKDGPLRRAESRTASERIVYLETREGRFVLLPEAKVYAAVTPDDEAARDGEPEENSPDRLLHLEPISTSYQALGTEVIAGRTTRKYRVIVNSSASANVSQNETLIWIDETLNMPVKSETKAPDGARTTMELTKIAIDPDFGLFQLPADYEKIPFPELRKQLKSARLNP